MSELRLNAPPTHLGLHGKAVFHSPDAYVILTAQNLTTGTKATDITVTYTAGGGKPKEISIGPEQNAPSFAIENFTGDKVTVTLTGGPDGAAAKVGVFGAGRARRRLRPDGRFYPLRQYSSFGCSTVSNYEQLVFRAPEEYSVVYLFSEGGLAPEPTAFCINAPEEKKVPKGYETTSSNQLPIEQNWEGNQLTMVNVSNDRTAVVGVSFTNLG